MNPERTASRAIQPTKSFLEGLRVPLKDHPLVAGANDSSWQKFAARVKTMPVDAGMTVIEVTFRTGYTVQMISKMVGRDAVQQAGQILGSS